MAMKNFYPPVMPTTIPTFILGTRPRIHFQISAYMNINTVNSNIVQVSIRKQGNNESAINVFLNGGSEIYTTTIGQDEQGYYIEIDPYIVQFSIGEYYKIQARFVNTILQITSAEFKNNLNKYLDYMSEWSSVCLIRPISKPQIFFPVLDAVENAKQIILQTSSLVLKGKLKFLDENEIETLDAYKVFLYEGDRSTVTTNDTLITETDWAFSPIYSQNEISFSIGYNLEDRIKYLLKVTCLTSGGCEISKYYYFVPLLSTLPEIENIIVYGKNDIESGCIDITIATEEDSTFDGYLVLKRASNKDNYKIWYDLQCFHYVQQSIDEIYHDYLIENGEVYRYQLVAEDIKYRRSKPINIPIKTFSNSQQSLMQCSNLETDEDSKSSDQYYAIIGRMENISLIGSDTERLHIRFDPNISNFQYTVVESKVETLGGKYPFIRRNGDTYYRQFSINGLITHYCEEDIRGDEIGSSMSQTDSWAIDSSTEFYKDDLMKRREKYVYNIDNTFTNQTQLENYAMTKTAYDNHFYSIENHDGQQDFYHKIDGHYDELLEKKYREHILEFLYKNAIRLFKSPTEGNILVKLMNISLTPKQELNRLVYNFTATAFEIDEYNVENCIKYGIHNINFFEEREQEQQYSIDKIGQVVLKENLSTIGASSIDVFETITNHWISTQTKYRPTINYLKWLRINFTSEPYKIYIATSIDDTVITQPIYIVDESYSTTYTNDMDAKTCTIKNSQGNIIFSKNGFKLFDTVGYLLEVNGTPIIVPPHGYYELAGRETEVHQLKILRGVYTNLEKNLSAMIDFEANVFAISNTNYLQASYLYYLIGQVNRLRVVGEMPKEENIVQTIIGGEIHNRATNELTPENRISAKVLGLSYVSIEGQPYTKIFVKDNSDDKPEMHILNETGILTLVCDNTYIEELYFDSYPGLDTSQNPVITTPKYENRSSTNNMVIYNDSYLKDVIINYVALVQGGAYG